MRPFTYKEMKDDLVNQFNNIDWNELNVDVLLQLKDIIKDYCSVTGRKAFKEEEK